MMAFSKTAVVGLCAGSLDDERDRNHAEEVVGLAHDGDLGDARYLAAMSSTSRAETFSPPTFRTSLSRSQ